MKKEQIVLCYLNALGAMGYSLIAPLFPPLFKERGIENIICSYIIAIICLTNIIAAIYCSHLSQKFGQLNLFLFSVIGQTFSTFFYGFNVFITNETLFIIAGFANRLFHGFCTGIVNVASFAITSQINKGKELETATGYMELSWGAGLTVGPTLIGILFDLGGYSLPFIIVGFITLSGVYYTYYILYKADLEKLERDSKIEEDINNTELNNENENDNKESYISVLKYPPTIYLALCLIIELNTLAFYVPTLVNYLKDSFDISTSKASLFFLLSTFGYVLCTQVINTITNLFNNFKIIFYGLFFGAFCCLFIAPMGILPHSYIFILIGIFCEGFTQGIMNIPTFIELTNVGKKLFPHNKRLQLYIPASVFNISFYLGDLIEPVIGSWITTNFYFQMSAYFACFLSVCFGIAFGWYFTNEINKSKVNEEEIKIQLIDEKLSNIKQDEN